MSKEKTTSIELTDGRSMRPMVFVEKNGPRYLTSMMATTLDIGKCELAFNTPNPVALFMSVCKKQFKIAKEIHDLLISPILDLQKTHRFSDEETVKLFDYFEHIQTCVISVYSAIETIANIAIPEGSKTEVRVKNKMKMMTKGEIERWVPTIQKIEEVLPSLLKIDNPNSLPIWNDFLKLKKLRDSIIHQKQDLSAPNRIDSEFLKKLMEKDVFTQVHATYDLIKHLCETDKGHMFFPIATESKSIVPIEVESLDTFFQFHPFKYEPFS